MKIDVDNFVNYLNKNTTNVSSRKRRQDEITFNDVIFDLKETAFERLENLDKDILRFKARELTKFLKNLKETFSQISTAMKSDPEIKKELPDIIRLALIAELAVCVDIIDEVNKYAVANRMKTFAECLKHCRGKLVRDRKTASKTSAPNPKKPKKDKPVEESKEEDVDKDEEDDEDYEDDSEYESSDDDEEKNTMGDNDDDEDTDSWDEEDETKEIAPKKGSKESKDFIHQIFKNQEDEGEDEIVKYYSKLPDKERKEIMAHIKEINNYQSGDKPILFQIMEMPLSIGQKNHILKTYTTLMSSRFPEKKLRAWFDALMTIPFGKYKGINLNEIKPKKVMGFLNDLETAMNNAAYGHDEAKRQIIQMMGQQIRNPKSKGNMLGIYGPPGNGKTTLIKEGIAKAMDKPFIFISLGGASDASFLEGHSYTYEGSIYGRIVNGLITAKCMDPIIYFDELDKISKTHKGDEITNILVHLTDPVQNSHFRDKYFHGIDIDLSRATMIFSFNDPSNVNPILMDRITTVETKYLMISQKLHIAQNYLLPEMMKDMGLSAGDVVIDNETIRYMIDNWTHEGGVRKLKSLLYSIVREVNIANLTKGKLGDNEVHLPFHVSQDNIKQILKYKREVTPEKIHTQDSCGIINGLYATSDGASGGIMPIQILWVPTSNPLEVKATGNLQTVIKESTQVASSLAFNYLTKDEQDKLLVDLKERPKGLHIHCPEGATPKDGPSAGTAITCAIYSMLTGKKIKHNVAITGEINLQGQVTAIGGLENKIEGAKKAGVTLVLYPKENEKDIVLIKERNPTLIDDKLKVIAIETIGEALGHALA